MGRSEEFQKGLDGGGFRISNYRKTLSNDGFKVVILSWVPFSEMSALLKEPKSEVNQDHMINNVWTQKCCLTSLYFLLVSFNMGNVTHWILQRENKALSQTGMLTWI